MIDYKTLIGIASVILGLAMGEILTHLYPKAWKGLRKFFGGATDHFKPDNSGWSLMTQSRIQAFNALVRTYGFKEARMEIRKLLPPHRKDQRRYTVIVGWLPPLDLELKIDSYQDAVEMCSKLKEKHPYNMFMPKWEKNRYDKAEDINWNLNDFKNRLAFDEGLGCEWIRRERKRGQLV